MSRPNGPLVRRLVVADSILCSCLSVQSAVADPPAAAAHKPFTDITRQSGLDELVTAKYAQQPQWWLSGLHLVDLDGNGHLDFFMSSHSAGTALAALGDGQGHFTLAKGSYPPSEIHLAYDANEDGQLDLTMTYQDGGGRWWLNHSLPGKLNFAPVTTATSGDQARRQALVDLDRDGKVDWLRGVPGKILMNRGEGHGGFGDPTLLVSLSNKSRAEALCIPVDLDGDGFIDLVTEWGHYDPGRGNSRILHNDGHMHFTDVTRESGLDGEGLAIKGVADLNGDGSPDLIVMENKDPAIYYNDGHGKFTKQADALHGMEAATKPHEASWGLAIVTDIDNDGLPDVLWNDRNFLWILHGIGGGRFEYMNRAWGIADYSEAAVDDGLCFGDIDGDGRLDIAGYLPEGHERRFALYHNDLPRRHWLNVRPVGRPGNRGAAGAKIRLFAPGTKQLLWYEQVTIYDSQASASYYSYALTERHVGLGNRERADVSVKFYPSGIMIDRHDVAADTTVEIQEPAEK